MRFSAFRFPRSVVPVGRRKQAPGRGRAEATNKTRARMRRENNFLYPPLEGEGRATKEREVE
jgi:hypothetical protein